MLSTRDDYTYADCVNPDKSSDSRLICFGFNPEASAGGHSGVIDIIDGTVSSSSAAIANGGFRLSQSLMDGNTFATQMAGLECEETKCVMLLEVYNDVSSMYSHDVVRWTLNSNYSEIA